MSPSLEQALDRGMTILTPNQRAARAISQAFNRSQVEALWSPANVMPLDAWMAGAWQKRLLAGVENRILLNRAQEQVIWEETVKADLGGEGLRPTAALAELAAYAWSLACLYNGRHRLREGAASTDSRTFERWARTFERRLERGRWITSAQLPSELAATGDLHAEPLALVDFDRHTPAVADLVARLQAWEIDTGLPPERPGLFVAEDDASELQAAAEWVRERRVENPAARIVVVVPNLADRRHAIDRIFAPILHPNSLPITAQEAAPSYEFSLGVPLAGLPMATTALDLLEWPMAPLTLDRISALLLSPWFAGSEAAAKFDAYQLRQLRLLRPELSLEATIRLASDEGPAVEEVASSLTRLQRAARTAHISPRNDTDRQSFSGWADAFRSLLEAAGWTRHAAISSLAFQQHRRWESALDQLATLDFDGHQPTAEYALAELRRILETTIFAPESQELPVQVVGPLELGGVAFDALWMLGADDLSWPPAPASNPLIAWHLQRSLGMPGADRVQDDKTAKALTRRVARSARQVVVSYARRAEEGERRRSPLLTELELQPVMTTSIVASRVLPVYEIVPDDVTLPSITHARGGAGVLKAQAACGFRAFAEKRLYSTHPDHRETGLSPLERGSLAHHVMENLWAELETQAALKAMNSDETDAALDRAIARAFTKLKLQSTAAGTSWGEAYLRVQRLRLHEVLEPWLEVEKARPVFTVQTPEQEKEMTLGSLHFKLRIDRIDNTAQGEVIVDYKTGLANPSQWQGERPDEPQLPLYAVLSAREGRPPAGVAFAILRAGNDRALKGYADDDSVFGRTSPKRGATLAEQVERWAEVLTDLAEAFADGDTRVRPKQYPGTCERCDQRIFCRLDSASLDEAADDEDDGAEITHG